MILGRISDGDPLGLVTRCSERMRSRAVLVSPDRLVARSLARTARAAVSYRGDPPLGEWLLARVDQAIEDLVNEDREDERSNLAAPDLAEQRYAFLANALGVPTDLARRACVVFNALPDDVRQTFWAILVDGKTIRRHVAEGHGPPEKVRRLLRRAILAISQLRDPGAPPEGGEHA